jgi:predicted transcriptional regulator
MTTISVPLDPKLEQQLDKLVSTYGSSRAAVMRKALERMAEDEAINDVLVAQREMKEGRLIRGDLETILADLQS